MEDNEQKSTEQLWQEFLEIINRQLETSAQLKELVESFAGTSAKRKRTVLSEGMTDRVKDLFVETEALLGEERAIYHSLFGTEE